MNEIPAVKIKPKNSLDSCEYTNLSKHPCHMETCDRDFLIKVKDRVAASRHAQVVSKSKVK